MLFRSSNSTATGVGLTSVEFGLLMATDQADSSRYWIAGTATAASLSAVNIASSSLQASDATISLNRQDADGRILDFAATPVVIATAANDSINLSTPASTGSHAKLSATASGNFAGFADFEGKLTVQRTVIDGTPRLHVGATDAKLFLGNNFGSGSAQGIQISNGLLGMVIAANTAGQPARFAIKATGAASATGISGITASGTLDLQLQRYGAAIDETVSVGGSSIRIQYPDRKSTRLNSSH